MPDGVRCVNYVNPRDSVANLFGQGHATIKDVAVVDAAMGATLAGTLAEGQAADVTGYLMLKPHVTRPNGPVIETPPVASGWGPGDVIDANHEIGKYLSHRTPFESTYRAGTTPHMSAAMGESHAAPERTARAADSTLYGSALNNPGVSRLSTFVSDRVRDLNQNFGTNLPAPREIVPWQNSSTYGSFVTLDERTLAQHTGRGTYQIVDVQRDLQQQLPLPGIPTQLGKDGSIIYPSALEHSR